MTIKKFVIGLMLSAGLAGLYAKDAGPKDWKDVPEYECNIPSGYVVERIYLELSYFRDLSIYASKKGDPYSYHFICRFDPKTKTFQPFQIIKSKSGT